jgi:L-asparaginase
MTRAKRYQAADLQVQMLREGIVESVHTAHAVVCDSRGRTLSVAGNAETATFIRSALKPFQALSVTASGTLETYGLDDRDLAIMCASHRSTMAHMRQGLSHFMESRYSPHQPEMPRASRSHQPPSPQLLW